MQDEKKKGKIEVQVKVRLINEDAFWGPGTEQVMRGIASRESVRDACRETSISYSKARKMIQRAEKGWETVLVERQQGGKNGGVSKITRDCEIRMALFEELEREVQAFAEAKFRELEKQYFLECE